MNSFQPKDIEAICKKNNISFLGLFGSYARGDNTENSDVDLLVEYKKPMSMFDHVRIQREFEEKLGKSVDLVTKRSVHPYIKRYVEKDLRVIYEE